VLARDPAARTASPFAAAFLSFLFPGLGQLYAGVRGRALAFAAAPILAIALLAGMLINPGTRDTMKVSLFDPTVLNGVLAADLVVFAYRLLAVVDAYRVALALGPAAPTRLGRPRLPIQPLSIAGLLAVILVLGMGHAALARYDRIAYETIVGVTTEENAQAPTAPAGASSVPTALPGTTQGTRPTIVPWNGTDRLNILLVGVDQRPNEGTFNTDTMIVASIDPASGQMAMFSLPRDTEAIPLPASWPAHDYFAGGVYPDKINSLWTFARANPNLFPGTDATRGYTTLKGAIGELMGIDVKYYVEVNFQGFTKVIDTLGGAMIDVQIPVADYHYPSDDGRGALKLYMPPGIQLMNGAEALAYARARHQTSDFDRSQRQQRVIVSVRQQTDVLSFLDPNRLQALSDALRSAVHTDFPAGQLPQFISLIEKVDLAGLRSYVFTPPQYQAECQPAECAVHYFIHPKVAAIQQAVHDAFTVDPALQKSRQKLGSEDARVWVLNGSGISGQAGSVADYLDYLGIGALVPTANGGRADKLTYRTTVVTFYNGAELKMPETIRVLEATFGVQVVTKDDPAVQVDVIVVTGKKTPSLQVPDQ
jgi:LCP family protein required for cell wall assembly